MSKCRVLTICVMIVMGLFAAGVLQGQTIFEDEKGYEAIFNGKDLTGWDGNPELWSVVDGAIRGQTSAEKPIKSNTFLVWRGGELKNFALKIKFRLKNGNSGIQYRSKEVSKWVVAGYQAEVINQHDMAGFLYEERGRGWLVSVGDIMEIDKDGKKNIVGKVADQKKLIEEGHYKAEDWNEYMIICRGNHIVHYMNGRQTMELVDLDPKGRALGGILALQVHVGPPMIVEYKDIRVRHLKENYGEAFRLFNGKDLNDWEFSSDENKEAWSVKDGIMVNKGQPGGFIMTQKDYTNYVLRLQCRHTGRGNGGVLLRAVEPFKVWPRSIEAQGQFDAKGDIWNIDKFPMKVDEKRTSGRHTRKIHPSNEKSIESKDWNEYEIYMNKGDLRLIVNGLLQNTATECWETPGRICLQSEGSAMEFRNIVLLPINKEQ